MGRAAIRVLMPLFWTWPSPENLRETIGNPDSCLEKDKHNNLSKRHVVAVSDNRESSNGQGHCDLSLSTFGIYDKFKKICHSKPQ